MGFCFHNLTETHKELCHKRDKNYNELYSCVFQIMFLSYSPISGEYIPASLPVWGVSPLSGVESGSSLSLGQGRSQFRFWDLESWAFIMTLNEEVP